MSMMRLRRTRLRFWIKKIPRHRHLRGTWLHKFFGDHLFSRDLWKPSRFRVAAAAAFALFWACMPIPFQMVPSAITACILRLNIPTAISVVWVTNPITWPIILYWQYRLGSWLLNHPSPSGLDASQLLSTVTNVPVPLILGCLVTGVVSAVVSFAAIGVLWSVVIDRWWHRLSQRHLHGEVRSGEQSSKRSAIAKTCPESKDENS